MARRSAATYTGDNPSKLEGAKFASICDPKRKTGTDYGEELSYKEETETLPQNEKERRNRYS